MTTFDATTVEALGWALVHFAWQGTLAAGVFGALTLAFHGAGARVRYALAAFTLASMALLPPLTVLLARTSNMETARPAASAPTAPGLVGVMTTIAQPAAAPAWPRSPSPPWR